MNKAIVVGATSGMGRELAKLLAVHGYTVGLTGRREHLLVELQQEIAAPSYIRSFDIAAPEAMNLLADMIQEMNGVDLVVISAGTGVFNPDLDFAGELETIAVNVTGFAAMANVAFKHFVKRGAGHLVGISSIAALRGSGNAPAYGASKAFVSNYLEGLRQKASKLKLPITITDVQPGFVDTAMTKGQKGLFWVASPVKAAREIYGAIAGRKNHVYITRRWGLIAWLLKNLPDRLVKL
ncbi:SDR family NAD(P)-dependent oxidoreductase [Desulfotomaculum copahuensis]|uniref:Oxidoreductase n=1 Tax=Desulfotomaculum copahuensis TaxID=1838280 RepID=A0A1B7LC83_9FIRM|nr:SDR family NAD(P)-dependent oxidoreductase [Desulfotomaculum copahuensis]OAT80323.1 oxidoreductase [Desulfotomaculum copahuensis]